MVNHDLLISNFCELTGASTDQPRTASPATLFPNTCKAAEYLAGSQWVLEAAVVSFYADIEGGDEPSAGGAPTAHSPEPEYTGPRTLDGRPAPQYAGMSSSSAAKKPQKRTGIATLGSMGGGHDHDDDDDDEDDDDEDDRRAPRDLFAGGEKSGLAVQDPNDPRSSDPRRLINEIVAKAKANSRAENEAEPGPSRSTFRGSGQTLGGDGVESRTIPDPRGAAIPTPAAEGPAQERILHIWTDGFSIDDGELRRFDDRDNEPDLHMIRQGRAPLHLMNVRFDQRVDVRLEQHQENYRVLPRVYRPFGGEGRRLGSPVPGDGSSTSPPAAPAAAATTAPATSSNLSSSTGVDQSQPTLMLRIQLPDGARLPARFNVNQTVGDVYEFIQRASPAASGRPWVLSTTFPSKDHTDKSLVLGEMAEFKKGGTAVVKWT
ncbi:hypothetical protein B0T19DRAFT_400948 [Cercophora scortea]|uniref:UBX domain-containing protein 1 n=1 Tax=Cercophora scortea TaxID=314031 RepID=A0AAE0IPK4_9PEZI|nr:hypothetical protein B0T19DRAFT_400948 [Cercophora scortea]